MHTLSTRRCVIACVIVAALAAAALSGVDRFGRGRRAFGHSGALNDPSVVKVLVDKPAEAYRLWNRDGFRGRTVVYVSGRWESFDPGELIPAQMYRAYPLQLYNTARRFEEEILNDQTFLYVATLNNICRRVVAIVPEGELFRLQEMSRKFKDAKVGGERVFVSRQGFPRWFMTAAGFNGVKEPVLLYVGSTYFKHVEPEELYSRLHSAGLLTDCIVLCNDSGTAAASSEEAARLRRFARLIGI